MRSRPATKAATAAVTSAAGQRSTCRGPHESVRRTRPTAMAGPAPPASAGRDELWEVALMLGSAGGGLRLDDALGGRREHRERDEWEEPRDVKVEPVRQHELEADQE